jgi:hypothetical protein
VTIFFSRRIRQQIRDFRDDDCFFRQPDQNVAVPEPRLMTPEPLAQLPFQPVSVDRSWKNALGNDKTDSRPAQRVGSEQNREPRASDGPGSREQCGNIGSMQTLPAGIAPAPGQTLRRARPLARRARITARPPRVRMRTRNPWVRFLRTTEGWNVRFIEIVPQGEQNPQLDDI